MITVIHKETNKECFEVENQKEAAKLINEGFLNLQGYLFIDEDYGVVLNRAISLKIKDKQRTYESYQKSWLAFINNEEKNGTLNNDC